MGTFEDHAAEWERNAQADPLYAILVDPDKGERKWDREAFFATGAEEIRRLFDYVHEKGIDVRRAGTCVDFGCGVGRLTRALAARFDHAVGIDVAETMVGQAERFNAEIPNVAFRANPASDLGLLDTGSVDFLYTNIVLQHIPNDAQRTYVAEFGRVCAPDGLVVFQLPSEERPRKLAALRDAVPGPVKQAIRRMLGRAHSEGVDMAMHPLPEAEVIAIAERAGLTLEHKAYTNSTAIGFGGKLIFMGEAEARSRIDEILFMSPMYFFRKAA